MSDEKRQEQRSEGFRGDHGAKSSERKPYRGNHEGGKPYGTPSGGDKVGFRGGKPGFRSGKPGEGGDRPARRDGQGYARGESAHWQDGKPSFSGEKREFHGEKKHFRGDNAHQGGGKPGFGGEKRSYRGDHGPRDGHKPPFRGDRRPAPKDKPEQMEGLASRRMALAVLRDVTENDAYASLSLDEKLRNCGLSVTDRRLVARLVYDTLDNLIYLDHALDQIMARPDTDIRLRNILRLGACQILLEDRIPESAATNTAVVLCKELGMEGLAGVCNGILRNLIRRKDELAWPDPAAEPVKALSVRHSVPEWLTERILRDWGEDAEGILSHRVQDTYVTVRPNLTLLDDAGFETLLEKKVWEKEPGAVAHSWRIRGMADVARDADFVGGNFSIQSESSMMAAMAVNPQPGMQVLDACAAPGGKACLMAEMMNGSGRVQAWDVHPHRTELIAAQARRLKLENIRPMTRDAAKPREELIETMDAVLLDAPCSGLGVMAEKPDVKYRVKPESVSELVKTQSALLDAVAPYVKKGGTLVYSTCSILKEENVLQAEAFLARHPEFELLPLPESIPERFRRHEGTGLQLLPQRDGVEGFYICRMRRKRV